MLVRALAASVLLTWPAPVLADEPPADGFFDGRVGHLITGGLLPLLVAGLVAAGSSGGPVLPR